jgi:DNA-binding transcriptional regulator YiaG
MYENEWRRIMKKHADERLRVSNDELSVRDGQHRMTNVVELCAPAEKERVTSERGRDETEQKDITTRLAVYDATVFVGLRTVVYDAAIEHIEEDGERTIELPKMPELLASAAVARCLLPMRLRGFEIKAIRRIMKLTMAELAKRLDEKTAVETISRWESEAQPMGGFAEKFLRLIVCEEVRKNAPGIEYNASKIANLKVRDPWKINPGYQVPPVELWLVALKQPAGTIIEAWNEKKVA